MGGRAGGGKDGGGGNKGKLATVEHGREGKRRDGGRRTLNKNQFCMYRFNAWIPDAMTRISHAYAGVSSRCFSVSRAEEVRWKRKRSNRRLMPVPA